MTFGRGFHGGMRETGNLVSSGKLTLELNEVHSMHRAGDTPILSAEPLATALCASFNVRNLPTPFGPRRADALGSVVHDTSESLSQISAYRASAATPVTYSFLRDTPHHVSAHWNGPPQNDITQLGIGSRWRRKQRSCQTRHKLTAYMDLRHRREFLTQNLQSPLTSHFLHSFSRNTLNGFLQLVGDVLDIIAGEGKTLVHDLAHGFTVNMPRTRPCSPLGALARHVTFHEIPPTILRTFQVHWLPPRCPAPSTTSTLPQRSCDFN